MTLALYASPTYFAASAVGMPSATSATTGSFGENSAFAQLSPARKLFRSASRAAYFRCVSSAGILGMRLRRGLTLSA